ncbi:MAG: RecX family transcriptional regulator [Bacteroidales bacterium]|nr:RecX family transcriptional regulator [Clostridium sp.]MCM1203125.1 RecX family transcriptional regulator [Bacteroidales bacterium]
MLITGIDTGKNNRYRVFGEDGFLFSLYKKELKQYHVEENKPLSDDTIQLILTEVVYKRGKERALYLLEKRPLSVFMLWKKLLDNEYPEPVIDWIVEFLETYHYLDDTEYVRMYIASYSQKKSKRQIFYDLQQRGIAKEEVEACFAAGAYSERACLEKQFRRYVRGKDLQDWAVRQKVFRYFYGKGFQSTLIEEALKEVDAL